MKREESLYAFDLIGIFLYSRLYTIWYGVKYFEVITFSALANIFLLFIYGNWMKSYALGEIPSLRDRITIVRQLWDLTRDVLVCATITISVSNPSKLALLVTWLPILYIFVCWLAIGNLYSLNAPCCLLVPLVWIYYLFEWTCVFKCSFDQSVPSSFLFTTYVSSSAIVIRSRYIWYLQKHDIFFDKFDT